MGSDFSTSYDYSSGASSNIDPQAAEFLAKLFGVFFIFFLLIALAYYIFYAICLMKVAKKTNTKNAWFAWIPILNIVLALQIAQKPVWWIILLFVPLVQIVILVMMWMALVKRLQKPEWLGILMIFPPLDLIVLGYLSFSNDNPSPPPAMPPAQPVV